jgi:hypothetical protein
MRVEFRAKHFNVCNVELPQLTKRFADKNVFNNSLAQIGVTVVACGIHPEPSKEKHMIKDIITYSGPLPFWLWAF